MTVSHRIAGTLAGAALAGMLALLAHAKDYPAPVRAILQHGVVIEAEFEAPGGLTGYVGRAEGQPVVLYVTADGEQAVLGPMLDFEGRNLSEEHIERYLPPPDLSAVWGQLEQAAWVREGSADAERVVYAFMDPDCPYCNAFWRATRQYVGEEVQLRHIMVGILSPMSLAKAARILGAEDPPAALAENERNHANGGIEPLRPVPPELRERVEANNRLMDTLGAYATPTIYYKDGEDRVQQFMGMPRLGTIAADIFQLPEQPPEDPALEQFR